MIKHIVLFKLKEDITADDKLVIATEFKRAIEALPAIIPWIRGIEVGVNINENESWHIALYSEFDSLEDLDRYARHPDHVAAAGILADAKEARSCVDYEF